MTKIEEVIRQVSDLRDFYIRLQRMKKASGQVRGASDESSPSGTEDEQDLAGGPRKPPHGGSDTPHGMHPG